LETLRGIDHKGDLDVDGKIILELILGKQGGKIWIGLIWLKIGAGGELL
jgi:hypothetical protein